MTGILPFWKPSSDLRRATKRDEEGGLIGRDQVMIGNHVGLTRRSIGGLFEFGSGLRRVNRKIGAAYGILQLTTAGPGCGIEHIYGTQLDSQHSWS